MLDQIGSYLAPMQSQKFRLLVVLMFVAVAAGRIIFTFPEFSRTSDEGAHIAAGMEWLDRGTYSYEYQHPPLARVAVALGPYLDGSRSMGLPNMVDEGDAILYHKGLHSRTLALARLGALPFFVIAAILVWLWSNRMFGATTALAAMVLFTTLPPVLAHSGLATTDMAFTAMFFASVYVFTKWIETPTFLWSLVLAIVGGFAMLSKFSTLLFLPACGTTVVALRYVLTARHAQSKPPWHIKGLIKGIIIIGFAAFFILWAGYRFHTSSLARTGRHTHVRIADFIAPESTFYRLYQRIEHVPLPLTEVVYGVLRVIEHNRLGHDSYLLGENRMYGWWYFFLVAFLVKTPIAFLVLAGIGLFVIARQVLQDRQWILGVPVVSALIILLAALPSNINIGLRHILPIYPFLSILAGRGVIALLRQFPYKFLGSGLVALLLGWQIMSGIVAHPDYLAHFNEFAGGHPERILINSDLDWGQDAYRLRDTLRTLEIQELSVAVRYHPASLFAVNPQIAIHKLKPGKPATGWIAISAGILYRKPGYEWLQAYTPKMTVGKSIYLYYLRN